MQSNLMVITLFLIFTGAAVFSTVALFTRQSLLVAYLVLGILIGPYGFRLITDATLIANTGEIGIIFLLFLLGLHLDPRNLFHTLRKTSWITLISSIVFFLVGWLVSYVAGLNFTECAIVGAAMMFSSTIIGLKLLPTTVLHHQHTGEIMISVLLLQDLIAIFVLLLIHGAHADGLHVLNIVLK